MAIIRDLVLLLKWVQQLRLGIKEIPHWWYQTQLRMCRYPICFVKQTHINQFSYKHDALCFTNKLASQIPCQPSWMNKCHFIASENPHPSCSGNSTIILEEKFWSSMSYISEERLQTPDRNLIDYFGVMIEDNRGSSYKRCLQFTYISSITHVLYMILSSLPNDESHP